MSKDNYIERLVAMLPPKGEVMEMRNDSINELEHILDYYRNVKTINELENAVNVFNATADEMLTNNQITSKDFEKYFEKESSEYHIALDRLEQEKNTFESEIDQMKCLTVSYLITDEQYDKIKTINHLFIELTGREQAIESTFNNTMILGSKFDIDKKLDFVLESYQNKLDKKQSQ